MIKNIFYKKIIQNLLALQSTSFKPAYKISFNEFNMKNKNYDYKNKSFKTLVKKSDPVSRF
jgi:hypothetical protein